MAAEPTFPPRWNEKFVVSYLGWQLWGLTAYTFGYVWRWYFNG